MRNALPNSIGSIAKRPGTIPYTDNALPNPIKRLGVLFKAFTIDAGTAPTLTLEVNPNSTLSGGTYDVAYTYVNQYGETTPSPTASVTVPNAIQDPVTAPTLAVSANTGSTLPPDTYRVAYTYKNSLGETLVSPEASITVATDQQLDITIPSVEGDSVGIYVGTDTLYHQADIATTTHSITSPIATTTVQPSTNTTQGQIKIEMDAIPLHADSINLYVNDQLQGEVNATHTLDADITAGNAPPTENTTTFNKDIVATSNQKLYSLSDSTLNEIGSLQSSDIGMAQFKDENGEEVLVIADGGNLKHYDGKTVADITPADDTEDVSNGLPANDLDTINADHSPKGVTVHQTRVVIWDGSDTIWHSKVGYYDYFPTVNYQRFVKDNDFIQTCHTYAGNLLVFMRRHIGVLFGDGYTGTSGDWSQDFLDTQDGCINPSTVKTVTLPNGRQEIFYLSDNGVHSVYTIDTVFMDNSQFYSTKSMTSEKIDWEGLGVTTEEWKRATAYFHDKKYWLIYPKGDEWHGLVYDTLSKSWYKIDNIDAHDFYEDEDVLLIACENGHLKTLDKDLYSDWDDKGKTTGTPIPFEWVSKLMTPKLTGYPHFWDVLMIEARQFYDTSTFDVEVNTLHSQYVQASAVKTSVMIVGETPIGDGKITNLSMTDLINHAERLNVAAKGQYAQIKLSNARDEPVEFFNINFEVRVMRR